MQSRYTLVEGPSGGLEVKADKAAPRLLPPELRRLPGELVTTDVDDPKRIHELDEPHTRFALIDEWAKPEPEPPKVPRVDIPSDADRRLTQWKIDIVRMRALRVMAETALAAVRDGRDPDLSVRYLWFPENDINIYERRNGNPPPDSYRFRPEHLRGMRLELDLTNPYLPASIEDALRKRGIEHTDHEIDAFRADMHKIATHQIDEDDDADELG